MGPVKEPEEVTGKQKLAEAKTLGPCKAGRGEENARDQDQTGEENCPGDEKTYSVKNWQQVFKKVWLKNNGPYAGIY